MKLVRETARAGGLARSPDGYEPYALVTVSTPGEQRILRHRPTRCMGSLMVACSSYDTASRTIECSSPTEMVIGRPHSPTPRIKLYARLADQSGVMTKSGSVGTGALGRS